MKALLSILVLLFVGAGIQAQKWLPVSVKENKAGKKVEIVVNGTDFTSLIQPEGVKKPVLWPVVSPAGNPITRYYPLAKKEGERADHPHHIGIWLNYGDVNGLDFWNNSTAIPGSKASTYGTINLLGIDKAKGGKKKGELVYSAEWVDSKSVKLLDEKTALCFKASQNMRIIDRATTLKASAGEVKFTDNKEGVFAIRVTSELELPAKGAIEMTDAHGNITKVEKPDMSKVTGNYLSSEGITGDAVWGTRGKWMQLHGTIKGEKVSVVIIDHPGNPGYPTYWHARGYGLFAANTLGQKALSSGRDELNFKLAAGQSVTFRYRMIIFSGELSSDKINGFAEEYWKGK
jgi:hypothetical protein